MTIIAARHADGVTWIGSDTLGVINGRRIKSEPKWIVGDWWAIGCAGYARLQAILPVPEKRQTLMEIVNGARHAVEVDGWKNDGENGPPGYGAWVMVASPEGVWHVCSAFSVEKVEYWADGSGADYAMGAMHAVPGVQKSVRAGLQAAIDMEIHCGGEVWMKEMK